MARRNLGDIKSKILNETIVKGSRYGVESVSTIYISKTLGISEPTIFVHFGTKKNLLMQAYLQLDKGLKTVLDGLDLENIDSNEAVYNIWKSIVGYFINNPDEVKYCNRYRHCPIYTPQDDEVENGSYRVLLRLFSTNIPKVKVMDEKTQKILFNFVIEGSVYYAEQVAMERIEHNEENEKLIFDLIFANILN